MSNEFKGSFVKKAAVLAIAGLIVRIIGFAYRVPLTNLINDEGNAIYGAGYGIYNLLLILSSAGLPAAISKMVSERIVLRQYRNAHRVFRVSLLAAICTGATGMLILALGAGKISRMLELPESFATILSLSPTLLIVAVMSVYRGYFQGMNIMAPTAISQIVEQIFNAIFSVLLAWLFYKRLNMGIAMGAAGGTIGTGIGAAAGLCFIYITYQAYKPNLYKKMSKDPKEAVPESPKKLLGTLLKTAVPIIAGTAIFSITNLIDMKMVMSRLMFSGAFSRNRATILYGQLQGKYVTLTTLPVSIATSLAAAAVPNIAASMTLKDTDAVKRKVNAALRVSMIIVIPASVGLGVLGVPIIQMLFPHAAEGGRLLTVGAVSIVFLSLSQIATGMLQGIGKLHIPVVNALVGSIVKIVLNYFLIANPNINIYGAIISTIACYVVTSILNLLAVAQYTKAAPDFVNAFLKPLCASIIMGIACYCTYYLFYTFVAPKNTVATLFSITVAMCIYIACMLLMFGFKEGDILLMPGGKKILYFLKRFRMI